jgi:hypothetical protein
LEPAPLDPLESPLLDPLSPPFGLEPAPLDPLESPLLL